MALMRGLTAGYIGKVNPDLERIIRPFQSRGTSLSRVRNSGQTGTQASGAVTGTDGEDIPSLTWTARASVEVLTLGARGYRIIFDDKPQDLFEISRTTHTVRVTNPEDPEQYVDVEVVDSVDLQDAANAIRRYSFNNDE